jgi:hypothetical protein
VIDGVKVRVIAAEVTVTCHDGTTYGGWSRLATTLLHHRTFPAGHSWPSTSAGNTRSPRPPLGYLWPLMWTPFGVPRDRWQLVHEYLAGLLCTLRVHGNSFTVTRAGLRRMARANLPRAERTERGCL